MPNPYLDRLDKAGKNPHGRKSEKRVAKQMGARLHRNSGASRSQKSDASLHQFRLEMKSTITDVLMLEMAWLVKIASEALDHQQVPAVVCSFVDAHGRTRLPQFGEWVIMPRVAFEELIDGGISSETP